MSESDYFDKIVRDFAEIGCKEDRQLYLSQHAGMINRIFSASAARSLEILRNSEISIVSQRHLLPMSDAAGITLIKSPKNTGKTTSLEGLLKDPERRVLFVGHRISLVRSASHQFDLRFYQEDHRDHKRYAVTLDSLWKVQRSSPYDAVVVDESEQLLGHFFSETMRGRQNVCIRALEFHLQSAKQVIALDADLGWASLNFFGQHRRGHSPKILLNDYVGNSVQTLFVHPTKESISEEINRSIGKQRCFVASDQKNFLNDIARKIAARGTGKKPILLITSDTAGQESVREFLRNPDAEAQRYAVVLASPTISSGIDISFETPEPVFERVFGVFHGRDLTHYECDQQLSRVRNPGQVDVWINRSKPSKKRPSYDDQFEHVSDQASSITTPQDDINERVANELRDAILLSYEINGSEILSKDHPLIEVARNVIPSRYFSRQFLKHNFLEQKKAQGWVISNVGVSSSDEGLSPLHLLNTVKNISSGRESLDAAKNGTLQRAKALVELLHAANLLSEGRFSTGPFDNSSLSNFQAAIQGRENEFSAVLGLEFGTSVQKTPVKIVNKLLASIGISVVQKKTMRAKKTVYLYRIEAE